jgi:hypothetical protein
LIPKPLAKRVSHKGPALETTGKAGSLREQGAVGTGKRPLCRFFRYQVPG